MPFLNNSTTNNGLQIRQKWSLRDLLKSSVFGQTLGSLQLFKLLLATVSQTAKIDDLCTASCGTARFAVFNESVIDKKLPIIIVNLLVANVYVSGKHFDEQVVQSIIVHWNTLQVVERVRRYNTLKGSVLERDF